MSSRGNFGAGASHVKRQPESPNVHISVSWPSKTPPKFHERTPKREKKEKLWQEREKRAKFWAVRRGGGPAEGSGTARGGRSRATPYNTTQHNTTQRNATQHHTTQQQRHTTQHNGGSRIGGSWGGRGSCREVLGRAGRSMAKKQDMSNEFRKATPLAKVFFGSSSQRFGHKTV